MTLWTGSSKTMAIGIRNHRMMGPPPSPIRAHHSWHPLKNVRTVPTWLRVHNVGSILYVPPCLLHLPWRRHALLPTGYTLSQELLCWQNCRVYCFWQCTCQSPSEHSVISDTPTKVLDGLADSAFDPGAPSVIPLLEPELLNFMVDDTLIWNFLKHWV